ncbi:hypothetical protein K2X05_12800 [bacterium]|nr:hypothetical protein [bacterium]
MAEFMFVLKSFLITCVVVYCFQYKIGDKTTDERVNEFLQKGALTKYIKEAGDGATRITASTYNSVKEGDIKLPFQAIQKAEKAKEEFEEYQESVLQKAEQIEKE